MLERRLGGGALATILAAMLSGCVSHAVQPPVRADHRYVLLGPEGVPVARVITQAAQCPGIEIDGVARSMSVRMPAETIPVRPSRSDPPKPSVFPVLTCEATLPISAKSALIGGQALPLPKANPQRIALVGDTGCRVVAKYNLFQACNDPAQWPFAQVANQAADATPDLVIHVGDYHYRDGPCKPGDAGCAGSPWGYGWDAWRADFFDPARRLLAAAPWIVVRGNHESCNRAGQGWWRFLDPRPVAPRQDCNLAADDDVGNYSDAYAVPIGRDADTQFLIFDSSWVGLTPIPPTDLMYRNYRAEFEQAFALGMRTARAWFVSHQPVLGFASNPSKPESPYPGNPGLQSVLQALYPDVFFPANVEAVISGHNHVLEIVNFSSPHPPQFITGNGGTWLDEPFPTPFPKDARVAPAAVVDEIVAAARFGFMTMARDAAGWRMQAWDSSGKLLTKCSLAARKVACDPIAGSPPKP